MNVIFKKKNEKLIMEFEKRVHLHPPRKCEFFSYKNNYVSLIIGEKLKKSSENYSEKTEK